MEYLLKLPPCPELGSPKLWFCGTGELLSPVASRRPAVTFWPKSTAAPIRARSRTRLRASSTLYCGEKFELLRLPTSNGAPVLIALKFGNAPVLSLPWGKRNPSERIRKSANSRKRVTHSGKVRGDAQFSCRACSN